MRPNINVAHSHKLTRRTGSTIPFMWNAPREQPLEHIARFIYFPYTESIVATVLLLNHWLLLLCTTPQSRAVLFIEFSHWTHGAAACLVMRLALHILLHWGRVFFVHTHAHQGCKQRFPSYKFRICASFASRSRACALFRMHFGQNEARYSNRRRRQRILVQTVRAF